MSPADDCEPNILAVSGCRTTGRKIASGRAFKFDVEKRNIVLVFDMDVVEELTSEMVSVAIYGRTVHQCARFCLCTQQYHVA